MVDSVVRKSQEDLKQVVTYPLSNQDDYHRFSATHIAYVALILNTEVPKSFKEAMKDKRFQNAMGFEVEALEENKT